MPRQRHVIIPDDLDEALQEYADARGLSIAAAVRVILHQVLKDSGAPSMSKLDSNCLF